MFSWGYVITPYKWTTWKTDGAILFLEIFFNPCWCVLLTTSCLPPFNLKGELSSLSRTPVEQNGPVAPPQNEIHLKETRQAEEGGGEVEPFKGSSDPCPFLTLCRRLALELSSEGKESNKKVPGMPRPDFSLELCEGHLQGLALIPPQLIRLKGENPG